MSEISSKTKYLLTLSMLRGVGPASLRKVADLLNFETLAVEELSRHVPAIFKSLLEGGAWSRAVADCEQQIEEAGRSGARILSPLDPDYPPLLAGTKDDPFLIFVRGRLAANPNKSVAIIGTREPTSHGVVITQRIATFFALEGWSVVSGLALGCDALAHQAALDARGHTVAVMAHGLQTVAPARHRKLAEDILANGGALVSEYRFGQAARPEQFVKRDRTQAGMAQGVVMVQSDLKGGSLHASRAALDYQRWLAVPYPTERDRANKEPKIQANLLIADGTLEQKQELLRCEPSTFERTIILRGRNEYPLLLNQQPAPPSTFAPQQRSFI